MNANVKENLVSRYQEFCKELLNSWEKTYYKNLKDFRSNEYIYSYNTGYKTSYVRDMYELERMIQRKDSFLLAVLYYADVDYDVYANRLKKIKNNVLTFDWLRGKVV